MTKLLLVLTLTLPACATVPAYTVARSISSVGQPERDEKDIEGNDVNWFDYSLIWIGKNL